MGRPARSSGHARVRETPSSRYATEESIPLAGVLFDSDVIIEILRGREAVIEAARSLESEGIPTFCSPVAWAEIYAGLRPGEEPLTAAFFEARGEVVLDGKTGERAGSYLARFARSHGVEIADALVAAAASTSGLHLWTLNRKHYPMADLRFHEADAG